MTAGRLVGLHYYVPDATFVGDGVERWVCVHGCGATWLAGTDAHGARLEEYSGPTDLDPQGACPCVPDLVSQATEAAFQALWLHTRQQKQGARRDGKPAFLPLALEKLDHASAHLQRRFERYLQDGAVRPTSDDEARAIVRTIVAELTAAATALETAAMALKNAGHAPQALLAHRAGVRAREQAQGLAI